MTYIIPYIRDAVEGSEKEEEFEVLKRWTELAFQSKSLDEFEEKLSL